MQVGGILKLMRGEKIVRGDAILPAVQEYESTINSGQKVINQIVHCGNDIRYLPVYFTRSNFIAVLFHR
jgi:hypothetical protein